MTTTETDNTTLNAELLQCIKTVLANNTGIQLISLCTTDGFNIKTFANKSLDVEADKISAMASALGSLSNSAANQMMGSECHMTTTETQNGHILFMNTRYLNMSCILTIAAKSEVSLAIARYMMSRLAKDISAISEA